MEQEELTEAQRRRRRAHRRNVLVSATVLFVIGVVISVAILAPRMGWFETKDYDGEGNGTSVTFTVDQGDGTATIAQKLAQKGVIANADYFVSEYQDKEGDGKFIQPGDYKLEKEMSSDSVIDKMSSASDENYVAINQNMRKDEVFEALAKSTGKSTAEFEAEDSKLSDYGIPDKFPSLEGWLHPGEYRFKKDASVHDMIQEMVDGTKKDLKDAGVSGDDRTFHVLTVASILEFEATPKDYSAVAGAIENRIDNPDGETSGYLQSDATVAYGLGKKTYQISDEQKQDTSNKYNTFANKGLPVGPIGSPDLKAIKAAANPDHNDYYYWVTVNIDTGETKFAKTYEEHEKNVEEYDAWCSDHEGKCS